jgi:hypothetical protein
MQGMVFADSAASGRRPYNTVNSSLIVPSGGYVVFGETTNTTLNGGVPVDYAYGAGMQLANSLDAVKFARVYGTDTLTIDRTQYSQASISAQDGVSRELKNPALDNSNMDGSNWASASVTSVFGPGGRGTPKAQNSSYVAWAGSPRDGDLLHPAVTRLGVGPARPGGTSRYSPPPGEAYVEESSGAATDGPGDLR